MQNNLTLFTEINFMNMSFYATGNWFFFCITFGLMLFLTFIMNLQSRYFFTKDVVVRKFSPIDLQLAATSVELINIIKGLYALPAAQSKKAIGAMKVQLYTDFLFMPCAYLSVFILCIKVAERMQLPAGRIVFIVLAWLQLISWVCDIIENIYLLGKIRPNSAMSDEATHKAYLKMEAIKWGVALTGAVCSTSAICYFWLAGHYSAGSLRYILIVSGEIILFATAQILFINKKTYSKNL